MKKISHIISTLVLSSALTGQALSAQEPVKVYILSGQSNMVGIGQTSPAGSTKYNTYVSPGDKSKETQGSTLSIYAGAYDPALDYSQKESVETHRVRVGYWPHKADRKSVV